MPWCDIKIRKKYYNNKYVTITTLCVKVTCRVYGGGGGVESLSADCVVYRPVGSAGELQGVQKWVGEGFEVRQNKALKRLHGHRGQGDGCVVSQSCDPCFGGTGVMVEVLKQAGTCLQRGVEDVCEHRRPLISTVLQGGGRDRVWPAALRGICLLNSRSASPPGCRGLWWGGGGGSEVGSDEEVQAPAVVARLEVWSWWAGPRGAVSGLYHWLLNRQ